MRAVVKGEYQRNIRKGQEIGESEEGDPAMAGWPAGLQRPLIFKARPILLPS